MRMGLIVSMIAVSSTVFAQTLTEDSLEKAQVVLDRAATAYGGADKIAQLESVSATFKTATYAANQSLTPGAPWDQNSLEGLEAIDVVNERLFRYAIGTGGGFEFENARFVEDDTDIQANFRAGRATRQTAPDFVQAAGPTLRVTPTLMLREMLARPNTVHYLGAADFAGESHDAIALVMRSGPAITLYVSQDSGLITRSERIIPGFGKVEYRFGDYRPVDGVMFNFTFDLIVNNEPNLERKISSVTTTVDFEPFLETVNQVEVRDVPDLPPMMFEEVADNTYLAGGSGTYGLFVDMGDYLIAVGATGGAAARIAALREQMPDKPIRYALVTHHHNDHLAGVPAYVAEGADLLVADSHVGVVTEAAGDAYDGKVIAISKAHGIRSGDMNFEAHVIGPTAHTEQLLLAYVPSAKLVFDADHFALPADGSLVPAVSSTKTFAKALGRAKLDIDWIASSHSPRLGTPDDLKKAVRMKPVNDKRAIAF